ncbi:MAG: hypothetical protein WAO74_07345 [Polaribacter sp.]|uniref:hypothetical protein n=1 Tax=Polaribacter sp. TaxID=1920175 RepID=UPI003BAEC251
MKNLLSIGLFFSFLLSHSQNDINETNRLKEALFESNIEENHFKTKNQNLKIFTDILDLEPRSFKKNSEGKFSFSNSSKNLFSELIETSEQNIFNSNGLKKGQDNNFNTKMKEEFIQKVIIKKMKEELVNYIKSNEALTYGDRNIDSYRNYTLYLENKLILDYALNPTIEIQLGKDIYTYLNKTLKTEIDKTLLNSLNLLAINF